MPVLCLTEIFYWLIFIKVNEISCLKKGNLAIRAKFYILTLSSMYARDAKLYFRVVVLQKKATIFTRNLLIKHWRGLQLGSSTCLLGGRGCVGFCVPSVLACGCDCFFFGTTF